MRARGAPGSPWCARRSRPRRSGRRCIAARSCRGARCPTARPRRPMSIRSCRAMRRPFADPAALVEIRIVDEPLPADRRARLLEVDAHHDLERVRGARRARRRAAARSRARAAGSWIEHGPTTTSSRSSLPRRMSRMRRAGRRHQRLDRRALDRKEADQVLGRRQQHHVDDVLVVGARRAVVVADHAFGAGQVRIRGHRFWLGTHAAPAGAHYRRCDSG